MNTSSELFSREAAARYDRVRLEGAIVALVGCGAAGNNIAQTLALSGVGELRLIDPDVVEPSNVTRSPLFRADRLRAERPRAKASECARAILDLSYARDPIVRSAAARVEDLGPAAFADCDVVIAAVDRLTVRARLADITRLLGVPLIECGFHAPRGQVSVYPNRNAEEPCWRCVHPHVVYGSASCRLYAERVVAEGHIPATQTLAATFGALAAEAAIQALHGEFPLGGHLLALDIRRGIARNLELTADPDCPGVHRRWDSVMSVPVRSTAPVSAIFDAVRSELAEPVLYLPEPFLRAAPCHACGALVPIGRPIDSVETPPACDSCRDRAPAATGNDGQRVPQIVTQIDVGDDLARWKAQRFGLRPGSIVEIGDRASLMHLVVALEGGPDDLYVTRRRATSSATSDIQTAADDGFAARD